MAIVKQDLFVIRDTLHNQIMPGAKSQFAFDTSASARRSLVHAGWWYSYKENSTIRKLMTNGNQLIDAQEQLQGELQGVPWQKRDPRIVDELSRVKREIHTWKISDKEYRKGHDAIKFDKQSRYVVECLVSVETKEIK